MIQKLQDHFIIGQINKASTKRGESNYSNQDKTYDKRKISKNSKSSKNLFKKPKNSIKRDEKSMTSKKVIYMILIIY
jgi:hypothetical protein